MRDACVELQWRVAGDVTVLAARVLEYPFTVLKAATAWPRSGVLKRR